MSELSREALEADLKAQKNDSPTKITPDFLDIPAVQENSNDTKRYVTSLLERITKKIW